MLLRNSYVQRWGAGGLGERLFFGSVSWLQHLLLCTHKDRDVLRMIKLMRRKVRGPLTDEAFLLYSLARAQSTLPGDFAEVGVSHGGSARMLCEGKRDKRIHLFDTFSGLPEASENDRGVFRKHQYACSLAEVQQYLSGFSNVFFYEGLFPCSTGGIAEVENATYSLAHFDVDLYEGTRACLEFFYPRMHAGGIMITHDYSLLAGVKRAFDEFVRDKPEQVIELPTTQCMIIKQPSV